MKMTAYGAQFECAKAVKGDRDIYLFDSGGNCIASFEGISDFSCYAISGGEWSERSLNEIKSSKISASKTQLAEYLETHPLTYTDGKQYSVTAEKQSLLTSALARHQIATAAGVTTALKWNATGEECTVWEHAELAALALAIAAYVEPLVAQQQAAEVAISACTTVQQVEAITIAYGS
ncbi:DUF4376 domain-containing protein [Oscillospiraceae bacterium LTW-04]|nr:hypothetical protein RBH76_11845 [Oscillospiraceae bacterium MB24-C1]